jgi:hypothetical protein
LNESLCCVMANDFPVALAVVVALALGGASPGGPTVAMTAHGGFSLDHEPQPWPLVRKSHPPGGRVAGLSFRPAGGQRPTWPTPLQSVSGSGGSASAKAQARILGAN